MKRLYKQALVNVGYIESEISIINFFQMRGGHIRNVRVLTYLYFLTNLTNIHYK